VTAVRRALTLTELLVVIGILALLAGFLLPVLFQAREKGRQAVCLSHLRQIVAAVLLYAHDWDETLPMNAYQATDEQGRPCLMTLVGVLRPFGASAVASCPTEPMAFRLGSFLRSKGLAGGECGATRDGGSYAINTAAFVRGEVPALGWQEAPPLRLSRLLMPTATVGLYDGDVAGERECRFQPLEAALRGRHQGMVNLGFLDGHVRASPTYPSGCVTRNINGVPFPEACGNGISAYRRRCGSAEIAPCLHTLTGLAERDERGECTVLP